MTSQRESSQDTILPKLSVSSVIDSFASSPERKGRIRRSTVGVLALQETIKEKQGRYREARENRSKLFDQTHHYIMEIMARYLAIEKATVEEFVLDSLSFQPFDDFFSKGGLKTLAFFFQNAEPPPIGDILLCLGLY
ncbi:dynein axonemal heavy chain 8-like [Mobula hypostoma]|uniref:dynein axonemal heavy chain 8-like n=1 Tax=Mobula hypostoma TaxID=723540 RepID=UPI002FC3A3F5